MPGWGDHFAHRFATLRHVQIEERRGADLLAQRFCLQALGGGIVGSGHTLVLFNKRQDTGAIHSQGLPERTIGRHVAGKVWLGLAQVVFHSEAHSGLEYLTLG